MHWFWYLCGGIIALLFLRGVLNERAQKRFEELCRDENLDTWFQEFAWRPTLVDHPTRKVFLRKYEKRVIMDSRGYPQVFHRPLGSSHPYGARVAWVERDRL